CERGIERLGLRPQIYERHARSFQAIGRVSSYEREAMRDVKSVRLQDIDRALDAIKMRCFGDEYELTLVARYTKAKYPDADVLFTNDDLDKVIAVIQKLKDRPPRIKAGDPRIR